MLRKLIIVVVVFTLITFITASIALASWYAGYTDYDLYGAWATIWTPSSPPYLAPPDNASGQSNWVSTVGPYWMQAGWLFYHGENTPTRYWEYCAQNCETNPAQYKLQRLSAQAWSTGVKYSVEYDGAQGPQTWCAWIDGVREVCKNDIRSAPSTMEIMTEVHYSTENHIDTSFASIRIRPTETGAWTSPNLDSHLSADSPYAAVKIASDQFDTHCRILSGFHVAIQQSGNNVNLEWCVSEPPYEVHVETEDPYFWPSSATLVTTTSDNHYEDTGVLGNPDIHHFYVIRVNSTISKRVGEYEYALVPGN